jgi:PAS domain S-box-containing protein
VPEDVDLFLILSNQLGAILESAQLEADIRARAAQLAALAVVSRTITAALRTEDVIQAILTNLRTIIPYDSVTLWLREGEQLRSAAAQGFDDDDDRLGLEVNIADSALFGEMARTRNAIFVPDVQADERFPAGALQPTRSWLGAPLVSKERILGVLALDKREPHFYSPLATQVLMAFANQAAVALDNAQLFEESQQRTLELDKRSQRLALLNRFSGQLSGTLKLDRIFEITLTEVMDALNVELGAMISYDERGEPTVVKQILTVPSTFDAYNPALLRVRESLAPLAVEDVTQDAVLEPARTGFLSRNVKSLLTLPLVAGGVPVAALQLEVAHTSRRFTPDEVELAQTLANQAAVAIQNARLYDETQARLTELATFDQISRAISSTLDLGQIFQIVGDQVTAVMGVDNLSLALYDKPTQQLSFPIFMEHGRHVPAQPREVGGLSAHIIRTRQPLLLRDHDARGFGAAHARSYLGVPLIIGDRVAGVLAVQDSERPNVFDEEHERVLSTIAAQVVVAIENARLFAEVQVRAAELSQRNERLAGLNRLSARLSTPLDLHSILEDSAEQVAQLFRMDHCGVLLFDEEGASGEVYAEYPPLGALGAQLPLKDYPLQEELLAHRVPVAVDDVATDPRLSATVRARLERLDVRSLLIVPFISQNQVIGSFSLDAIHKPHTFTTDERELCQTIAAQIASAVENARFTRELETRVALRTQDVERERERVETLLQISTELSSSLDLNRVLSRALQLVTEVVNAPRGSVFILDLESDQLIHRAAVGRARPLPPNGELAPFKRNEGLVGWVMKNRQGVVIGDLEQDPRWQQFPDHPGRYRSALAVPLMANEDALGAMILLSPEPNAFDEDQLRLVSAAADRVGDAINNAELYRLIREQAEKLGALLREQQVEATKSRAILEGIADGVLVAETGGDVILFNAACERILGLKRAQVVGRPMNEFLGIYGAAGKAWLEAVERWSADPYSYTPGEFFDERIETDNQRVLSVHLAPVIDSDEFLGSVSVIRDITRDVEVDRLKSEFVTNVSHELRTPMTSIKGYADILLMGAAGSLTEDQSRFLEVIKNNADRLSILVNDLLDISRIESGQVQLVLRPIQTGEVITMVLDTLRGRIDEENKPMTLEADVPADLPPVEADRERLTQILMNLADNAFNYSQAGGAITLRARVDPAHSEMLIEVSDSGIGIAPEDQGRLFDRFYRGEDELVLATAGTGLGLPIAQQLAEMHGGRLWLAHSELGQGSTFALTLPLAASRGLSLIANR